MHFSRQGLRVAVIVNDHGAINVDRIFLEEALKDSCHLEMVIGGDRDCSMRRLKTKLIAMGMEKYDRVIVEPSGVFDAEDFFDLLYDEPLERWYEPGSVVAIVDSKMERDFSEETGYLIASQVSKAGVVILSKSDEGEEEREKADTLSFINDQMERFGCKRKIEDCFIWKRGKISDEEFKMISLSGYKSDDMIRLPISEGSGFDNLFYFNPGKTRAEIKEIITRLFDDPDAGKIHRIKGFVKEDTGWCEVNAVNGNISIKPSGKGQDLFIVIGENLNKDLVDRLFDKQEGEMTVYQVIKNVVYVLLFVDVIALAVTIIVRWLKKKKVLNIAVIMEIVLIPILFFTFFVLAFKQYKESEETVSEVVETAVNEEEPASGDFKVESSDLKDGVWDDAIANTERGENLSPQLSWDAVAGAKVYVVYMIDPDGNNWLHMKAVSYDTDLDRGEVRNELKTEYIEPGYIGPYPPGGTHTYDVYIFALKEEKNRYPGILDRPCDGIEPIAEKLDVMENGDIGNVLGMAYISGTYTK